MLITDQRMWKKTFRKSHFQKKTFICVNLLESFCNCRIYLQLLADCGSNGRTCRLSSVTVTYSMYSRLLSLNKGRSAHVASWTRRQQSWMLQHSTVCLSLTDRLQLVLTLPLVSYSWQDDRSEDLTSLELWNMWLHFSAKVMERIKFRLCVLTHRF